MNEYTIGRNEEGQRLDRYLAKLLDQAPGSFIYKMLRKKNITLNGRRAAGNERLAPGDQVRLFLAEDTVRKFQSGKKVPAAHMELDIVYEDQDIVILNKPAGVLSQPDASGAPSMTDYLVSWLAEKGEADEASLKTFRPAVCNRLDRNTSGLLLAGRSLAGLRGLSKALREGNIHKEYLCLALGRVPSRGEVKGFLFKDEKKNKVRLSAEPAAGSSFVHTIYEPLACMGKSGHEATLLKVLLLTGKTHQIRASLAKAGYPLAGDVKYGGAPANRYYREQYGLTCQLLHAWRITFGSMDPSLSRLEGLTVRAPLPSLLRRIAESESGMPIQRLITNSN